MTDTRVRVDLARMRAVYDATRADATTTPVLSQRAVARIDQDLHMVGRVGRFQLESDEPPSRGGLDQAPAPLQLLLAGAAF